MVDFVDNDEFNQMLDKARSDIQAARRALPEAPTTIRRSNGHQAPQSSGPEDSQDSGGYDKFLEILYSGNYPEWSELTYDEDEGPRIHLQLKLDGKQGESAHSARIRTWQFFRRFKTLDRKLFRVSIKTKELGKPTIATISTRPGAITLVQHVTERLRALKDLEELARS